MGSTQEREEHRRVDTSRHLTLIARLNTSAVDARRGVVRLHAEAIAALGIREWDAVSLTGSRTTSAVVGLARMYLNAEVYAGTPMWTEAKSACEAIFGMGYSLCPEYSDLFRGADGENADALKEIIFGVAYDADLELAERVLLETIQRHPLIVTDPPEMNVVLVA